jgi:hypothetical protein
MIIIQQLLTQELQLLRLLLNETRKGPKKPTVVTMVPSIAGVLTGYQLDFLINIGLSLLAGFLIDAERESRGKAAGISSHSFVIAGSMIFTYLSHRLIQIH